MTTQQRFITLLLCVVLLGALTDCKKNQQQGEKKPVVTMENLQTAYNVSMKRNRWYSSYATYLQTQRQSNLTYLFRAIARSEAIRADVHAKLLRAKGTEPTMPTIDSLAMGSASQALKMAMSCETMQSESMYPSLIRTAELEKFPEAVEQFKQSRDADVRHLELFRNADGFSGNIARTTYYICPSCGYILTTDKTPECPTCKTAFSTFEKI
jgi:rubrerythrin